MIEVNTYGRKYFVLPYDECYHCQSPALREAGFSGNDSSSTCIVYECGSVHYFAGDCSYLMIPCSQTVCACGHSIEDHLSGADNTMGYCATGDDSTSCSCSQFEEVRRVNV